MHGRVFVSAAPRSILFTVRVVLVLALLLPPLWLRLRFVRGESEAFRLVRRCARRVLRAAGCRLELLGADRLPARTNVMFVCNHVSVADAAVLLAALPFDFRFVANHVYAGYPLLGAAIRGASASIVDRGSWRSRADSGKAMVEALANGQSLLVFPEGTTSDGGDLLPFRSGAFRASVQTGRPVVPIVLRGTREMMPAGRTLMANVPIRVEILQPLDPPPPTREGVSTLRDRAATAIRENLAATTAPKH